MGGAEDRSRLAVAWEGEQEKGRVCESLQGRERGNIEGGGNVMSPTSSCRFPLIVTKKVVLFGSAVLYFRRFVKRISGQRHIFKILPEELPE